MTTTRETCVCECEECLGLRDAEDNPGSSETVAAFEHDGSTYEIDHLGVGSDSEWDVYVVYCDGEEVAEFTLAESVLRPGSGPAGRAVSADELVRLARQALSGWTGRGDPPYGLPPGPLPAHGEADRDRTLSVTMGRWDDGTRGRGDEGIGRCGAV